MKHASCRHVSLSSQKKMTELTTELLLQVTEKPYAVFLGAGASVFGTYRGPSIGQSESGRLLQSITEESDNRMPNRKFNILRSVALLRRSILNERTKNRASNLKIFLQECTRKNTLKCLITTNVDGYFSDLDLNESLNIELHGSTEFLWCTNTTNNYDKKHRKLLSEDVVNQILDLFTCQNCKSICYFSKCEQQLICTCRRQFYHDLNYSNLNFLLCNECHNGQNQKPLQFNRSNPKRQCNVQKAYYFLLPDWTLIEDSRVAFTDSRSESNTKLINNSPLVKQKLPVIVIGTSLLISMTAPGILNDFRKMGIQLYWVNLEAPKKLQSIFENRILIGDCQTIFTPNAMAFLNHFKKLQSQKTFQIDTKCSFITNNEGSVVHLDSLCSILSLIFAKDFVVEQELQPITIISPLLTGIILPGMIEIVASCFTL